MKNFVLLNIALLLFTACEQKAKTPLAGREDDLKAYFSDVFQSKIPTLNEQVIFLNNQSCSTCRVGILVLLTQKLSQSKYHRTYILMKSDSLLISNIKEDKNASLKIDTSGKSKKYGLNYSSDFIYTFKQNRLIKKEEISNSMVRNLK